MPDKFLWYDLRVGIVRYGILHLGLTVLYFGYCLIMSMWCEDPHDANEYTTFTGGALLNVLIKGSMTYGAHKESRTFLLPFLIAECAGLILMTGVCLLYIFMYPVVIIYLLLIIYFWYVWLCVLSLYQTLDPHNPNYVPKADPSGATIVCVDPPPPYYENENVDAV